MFLFFKIRLFKSFKLQILIFQFVSCFAPKTSSVWSTQCETYQCAEDYVILSPLYPPLSLIFSPPSFSWTSAPPSALICISISLIAVAWFLLNLFLSVQMKWGRMEAGECVCQCGTESVWCNAPSYFTACHLIDCAQWKEFVSVSASVWVCVCGLRGEEWLEKGEMLTQQS